MVGLDGQGITGWDSYLHQLPLVPQPVPVHRPQHRLLQPVVLHPHRHQRVPVRQRQDNMKGING